jgi:hypothetical protein
MPAYPAGFVAFAPSPGPIGELYAEYESASAPPSPETSKSSQSMDKRSYSRKTAKRKEKDSSPGWEHNVVAKGGLCRVSEIPEDDTKRKSGVRNGKLNPQTKEKARRIRKISACWICWIQKVPVSLSQLHRSCP